jgi:hypothetical protein
MLFSNRSDCSGHIRIGHSEGALKRTLDCPCGQRITAEDEDTLVAKAKDHLAERHPDKDYSRDEILFLAF